MVNFGLNPASLLGIALAVAGAALYFLRSFRPELSRDHDIFFAAVGLLCGLILLSQGWRLDPILQFGQFLLAGSTIFFAFESVRLRGVATEQAKRSTPIVDDDRPVSRVYRAELDELEYVEEQRSVPRRIRGTKETRPSRGEDYEEESYRRPPTRSSERPSRSDYSEGESTTSRRRRPRTDETSEFTEDRDPEQNLPSPSRRPSRNRGGSPGNSPARPDERNGERASSSSYDPDSTAPSRPRRPRPTQDADSYRPRRPNSNSTEYVDYKPIDYDESDNSANFNS